MSGEQEAASGMDAGKELPKMLRKLSSSKAMPAGSARWVLT